MVPGVPPMKPWLAGAKVGWGVDEHDPRVRRVVEILKKKEEGEISTTEHKECLLLNAELIGTHEDAHGKRIHPTGELVTEYKPFNREEEIAAIDDLFRRDQR
jgi:hypothetical protein